MDLLKWLFRGHRKCPFCEGTNLRLFFFNDAYLGPATWTCLSCTWEVRVFRKRMYSRIEKRARHEEA